MEFEKILQLTTVEFLPQSSLGAWVLEINAATVIF
jgi:hypothetical protein